MFLLTLSAIFILCVKNPLYAVFGLILVFLNSAFVLLSLEVNYLALVYVVLYVGAICVLFLFVVMLLNLRVYDVNNRKTHRNELILFFLSCLVCMVSYLSITKPDINTQLIITTISNVLTELHATDIVTSYLFQNIMVVLLLTLLLLLAIVSPIIIASKSTILKKKQDSFFAAVRNNKTTRFLQGLDICTIFITVTIFVTDFSPFRFTWYYAFPLYVGWCPLPIFPPSILFRIFF